MTSRFLLGLSGLLLTAACGSATLLKAEAPAKLAAEVRYPDDATGHIIVPVRLQDGREYPFVVDTGAGSSVVDQQLAKSLGLRRKASSPVMGSSARLKFAPVVQLESLALGDAIFEDVGAVAMDLTSVFECSSVAGIIGANVLAQGVLEIDYENKVLRLARNAADLPKRSAPLSIPLVDTWTPRLELEVPGAEKVRFLVDTGFNGSIFVTDSVFRRIAPQAAITIYGELFRGVDGKARPQEMRIFRWPEGTSLAALEGIEAKAGGLTNIIGQEALSAYTVRLDYPAGALQLWRNAKSPDVEHRGFGMAWGWTEEKAVVKSIVSRSPAEAAGLVPGDEILSVNGTRVDSVPRETRCTFVRDANRAEGIELALRAGDARIIRMQKAELLP